MVEDRKGDPMCGDVELAAEVAEKLTDLLSRELYILREEHPEEVTEETVRAGMHLMDATFLLGRLADLGECRPKTKLAGDRGLYKTRESYGRRVVREVMAEEVVGDPEFYEEFPLDPDEPCNILLAAESRLWRGVGDARSAGSLATTPPKVLTGLSEVLQRLRAAHECPEEDFGAHPEVE